MNPFKKLKEIVWKDLFKHRWMLIVEVERMPNPKMFGIRKEGIAPFIHVPTIKRVPIKRTLNVPYDEFYNYHSDLYRYVITGSKRTIRNLGGIGSTLPHNFKNHTVYSG